MPTVTPRVPIQTPMFDERGLLTRTWVIFFERLGRVTEGEAAGADLFHRTLLLKDTAVGNDVADHVTVYGAGTATRIVGVLRLAISSNLTVRVRYKRNTPPGAFADLVTITIPAATAVNTPVEVLAAGFSLTDFIDGDVFAWDVTASDGQVDAAGVASFTLDWQAG